MSRAQLITAARSSGCRVVAVTAPAGYGKTTLLTEWAHAEDRPVAWVSLSRLDDDAGAMLALLASAFAAAVPGNTGLVADVGGLGVSALGWAAPRLASALNASQVPFVLMLDDLHELRSPACQDFLEVVISGIPRGSQLVAASRAQQRHLPRLRAAGDAHELSVNDLAMDADGAEHIFSQTRVSLTREVAVALTERTEGWPVGLYLAAVITRDSGAASMTLSGEDPYVADYLYRESLAQVPEEVQHFLRCTAVPDQVSAPLCEALLGEQGAQEQLRQIEASNAFMVPLDRRREWYRYHPLFREFLLGELRRVEPERMVKLHLLTADWYESNGSPEIALEHLLKTAHRDRCVRLVTQLALPTYQAGQLSTVQRWLSALGVEAVEQYPPLAVLAGWIAVLSGQTAEAERWAAIVEAASFEPASPDGSVSFDSARAMLRASLCANGPEPMLADATFALTQEPAYSVWRDTALVTSAEACLLRGDVGRATVLFAEASAVGTMFGNLETVAVSEAELSLLAMDRGHWVEAAGRIEVALKIIDDYGMDDYAVSLLPLSAAARLALHRGDQKQLDGQLTRALRARPSCTHTVPYIAVRARLQLARVYWARGDRGSARHLLREIDDILLHRSHLGALIDEVSHFRDVMTVSVQATGGGPPLSPAELRLLPYLQTHLTMEDIGERLFVSRNTVRTEVASIYRKLGVSSRRDAVQHATEMGMLGA